jgi:GT2 family glycosyltransferase
MIFERRPVKITVVVLTWNGAAYVENCLASLLADEHHPEVIVVDNGSTDGTPELVSEHFTGVQLIRNERNLGFAAGNNVGLGAATGDLLVLLNVDTRVHPGWLSALATAFEDPAVGVVGCKLLYPDGTIQHAGAYLYGPRGATEHIGRFAQDNGRFDELADVDFVTGAALAIRREALEQIGLLDEGFAPIYYEDVDWCYRARAAGFRVVYQPHAVVTHYESTTSTEFSYWRKSALNHGRVRFLFKHRSLDLLLHEFGPAECAWVAAMDRHEELMAARRAYLDALLALPGILAFRGSSQYEAEALAGLLTDLRAAALVSLLGLQTRASLLPALSEPIPGALQATPAPSGLGEGEVEATTAVESGVVLHQPQAPHGLFAKLGRLWRALRYLDVLPDLVAHVNQHDRALEDHSRALGDHGQALGWQGQLVGWLSRRADQLEGRSTEHGDLLRGQLHDVAENVRELTALAERLSRLEEARRRGDDCD